MDTLISSFSQLNIYERNIINNIITKNNNNLDELINSFENININSLNLDELNESFEKINISNITENLEKSICSFIDFFKLLRNKKKCNNSMNHCMPNWIC